MPHPKQNQKLLFTVLVYLINNSINYLYFYISQYLSQSELHAAS